MREQTAPVTLAVFSHPNHEIAIYGAVGQSRPFFAYLTDGGGASRVAQTREGLARLGLLDRAHFLDFTEQSFYDALLDRDHAFFDAVASRLAEVIDEVGPQRVLCDAVEFYNPVHDLSLPIVRAAIGGRTIDVFEVPLVHQSTAAAERYDIQRPFAGTRGERLEWRLSEDEVDAKIAARDHVYTILTAQMGETITGISRQQLAEEVAIRASGTLPAPGGERVLRYEWRAKLLHDRGEIDRMITFRDHYLPVATALLEGASSPPA